MNQADIGVVGLGVMGAALARNFHSRGLQVAAYNLPEPRLERFRAEHGGERLLVTDELPTFVQALARPRKVLVMVTAGRAVDAVLEALAPLLDDGDIVVDGGNSHFPDTARRERWAAERGLRFFGMGVSGGESGALLGPAMMPGGDREAWTSLRPILEAAAARSDYGPCVGYCGRSGAGHFVKMVHNGIEYADMQLIAEAWTALRALGLGDDEVADTVARWNDGPLHSYLVGITADILQTRDRHGDGLLVDQILDVAGQKGTGRWTAISAIELGVPVPTITAAVDARAMSARKSARVQTEARFAGALQPSAPLSGLSPQTVEDALLCAKLMSYSQGFALLAAGSAAHDFAIDAAECARIWTGGCIIRAGFLGRVQESLVAEPDQPLLFASQAFAPDIVRTLTSLRSLVASSAQAGLPVPAMAASLSYFETLARGQGSAALIQAQRDYFGAHTYRRIDDPDTPVHTEWG